MEALRRWLRRDDARPALIEIARSFPGTGSHWASVSYSFMARWRATRLARTVTSIFSSSPRTRGFRSSIWCAYVMSAAPF